MKLKEFKCKKCGKLSTSGNAFRKLCSVCNEEFLNSKKPMNLKKPSKKPKKTGEKEMFLEIWDERPHYCVHCGKFLGDEAKAIYFSHIKAKSIAPSLRLDKNNIEILCERCHTAWDFGERWERK